MLGMPFGERWVFPSLDKASTRWDQKKKVPASLDLFFLASLRPVLSLDHYMYMHSKSSLAQQGMARLSMSPQKYVLLLFC